MQVVLEKRRSIDRCRPEAGIKSRALLNAVDDDQLGSNDLVVLYDSSVSGGIPCAPDWRHSSHIDCIAVPCLQILDDPLHVTIVSTVTIGSDAS